MISTTSSPSSSATPPGWRICKKHPEQMPEAIKVIRDAVGRGAALVQQLLTSARQTGGPFCAARFECLVQELEKMLGATFPKTINFVLHLQPNLPLAKADRSQIHQVLLNLCVNARDAMPTTALSRFETGVTDGAELRENFTGVTAENYVFVRVIDTGTGISKRSSRTFSNPSTPPRSGAKDRPRPLGRLRRGQQSPRLRRSGERAAARAPPSVFFCPWAARPRLLPANGSAGGPERSRPHHHAGRG